MKFVELSLSVIKLYSIANDQRGITPKISRVMVVVHDTPSECALRMFEVSPKYL